MEDDLRRGLLSGRKGPGFDKLYEDCMVRIEKVKLKNDAIQRQIGTEIEETLRSEVRNQKAFIEVHRPSPLERDRGPEKPNDRDVK